MRQSAPVPAPRRAARIARQGLLLTLALLATTLVLASRPTGAQTIDTSVPYAVVMDARTGAVLFAKAPDTTTSPASMSKLMTLEVIYRALKNGQVKFEDEYPVSPNAYKQGGERSGATTMFLPVNSTAKLSDLVLGIAIASANDACIVAAEGMAGSEESFAKMMTEQGRKLGLTNSNFANSTGLPNPDQRMSMRDLALLSRHLINAYPEYYAYLSQRNVTFNGKLLLNKNPLLSMNIGADGLKTGGSADGGLGIVGAAQSEGRRVIVALNGAKSEQERAQEARKLIDWGFRGFKEATIFDPGEVVAEARVWGGTQYFVPLVGNGPVRIVVPRAGTQASKLKASISYQGPLKAPIAKGDEVAMLRVESPDGMVNEVPLYAGADVPRSGTLARGLDSIVQLTLGWVLR